MGVLLLRVQLPDRPGSLGAVATAMGTEGADISAIEIVEKGPGYAINDFMLTMPPESLPDTLISACTAIDGVRVLWLSRYPVSWGLASDIDTLNQMTASPENALDILAALAPKVFHSQWAVVLDPERRVVHQSDLAPDLDDAQCDLFAPFDSPHVVNLPNGWLPGWNEVTAAVVPASRDHLLVIGRQGGPDFLDSELRRLEHLAALAK